MRILQAVLLVSALLMCLLSPGVGRAQDRTPLVVFDTDIADQDATMGLDVYFVIRDEAGRPIPDADIKQSTLRILDDPKAVVESKGAAQADSPIYIAMLLDTSGSMQPTMPAVRAAAQQALDQAPPNASIGVARFSDAMQLVPGLHR
ncbi:MAG: hypothetical protein IPK16_28515 [Anaerolineales bacterium]|nr:hypothetical protein [Anaerolineales bacterium]